MLRRRWCRRMSTQDIAQIDSRRREARTGALRRGVAQSARRDGRRRYRQQRQDDTQRADRGMPARTAPTLATHGNLNNDIGMPLMLARIEATHRYAVLEMGANHAGEIAYLTALAKPDVVVITNAGAAHLEGFGSIEGVARAKGEILQDEQAPAGGRAQRGRSLLRLLASAGRGYALHQLSGSRIRLTFAPTTSWPAPAARRSRCICGDESRCRPAARPVFITCAMPALQPPLRMRSRSDSTTFGRRSKASTRSAVACSPCVASTGNAVRRQLQRKPAVGERGR